MATASGSSSHGARIAAVSRYEAARTRSTTALCPRNTGFTREEVKTMVPAARTAMTSWRTIGMGRITASGRAEQRAWGCARKAATHRWFWRVTSLEGEKQALLQRLLHPWLAIASF